jgi:hypothetical protein
MFQLTYRHFGLTLLDTPLAYLPYSTQKLQLTYLHVKTENTAVGIRRADHATPIYLQKLKPVSPTSGGRSVGIVRCLIYIYTNTEDKYSSVS